MKLQFTGISILISGKHSKRQSFTKDFLIQCLPRHDLLQHVQADEKCAHHQI